jgi:protein phosphatase
MRKANEDSKRIFEVANMKVFVVCDGMGGHVGGKMASETAISAIHNYFLNNITLDPRETIHNSIIAANEAILNKTRQQPELAGMGSTCVMLVVTSDGKAYYGHVGDSRIYIVANHRITQLTEDHSVVYEMFKAGAIKTREEMERHPRKNEITNALGLPNMQPPTICNAPIEVGAGNCFLLCSDGLTGMVDDEQIQRIISKHEIPIQQRADKLVEMANNNGGLDNITVELVEFTVSTQEIGNSGKKPKNWKTLLFYGLPLLVLLGSGVVWLVLTKPWEKSDENADSNNIVTTETAATGHSIVTEIILKTYFAKPVTFTKKGETLETEITDMFFNDSIIDKNEVAVENSTVSFVVIEGKKISAKWKTKCDTVTIFCKTKTGNDCTIKIPVKEAQSGISAKKTSKIVLNAIAYNDNDKEPVTVKVDGGILLTAGNVTPPKATTNQEAAVRCSVSTENNLVLYFRTPNFESPIIVTVETANAIYEFSIPVKIPENTDSKDSILPSMII